MLFFKKNKKIIFAVLICILLIFDYAALDDITTGRESSYSFEYVFLLFSAILITVILGSILNSKSYGNKTLR